MIGLLLTVVGVLCLGLAVMFAVSGLICAYRAIALEHRDRVVESEVPGYIASAAVQLGLATVLLLVGHRLF